jgi:hypothetical protein
VPAGKAAAVTTPTIVLQAGEGEDSTQRATRLLASALWCAQHETLENHTLQAPPDVIAPVLLRFFGTGSTPTTNGEAGS